MKKEKIILSLVAIFIGLLVAGAAFYLYESTNRMVNQEKTKTVAKVERLPTPKPSIFLTVDLPKDEEVVTKKVITIVGKTISNAIVSIISKNYQDIITPSQNGGFSTTLNINDGQNIIEITAISPNGEIARQTRTVTFSTEEF